MKKPNGCRKDELIVQIVNHIVKPSARCDIVRCYLDKNIIFIYKPVGINVYVSDKTHDESRIKALNSRKFALAVGKSLNQLPGGYEVIGNELSWLKLTKNEAN